MKLSVAQQNLMDAMKAGTRVLYSDGLNAHYFRCDTMRSCSSTVHALKAKGLVDFVSTGKYGKHDVKLKDREQETGGKG